MKKETLFKVLFVTSFLTASFYVNSEEIESISDVDIKNISTDFNVKREIVKDYVSSYDFKCPDVLNIEQLKSILSDEFSDNELNIMLESERMSWRDVYLDARSDITCLIK